jgi:uncharacterized membrane protein YhaH (DUF805 family)
VALDRNARLSLAAAVGALVLHIVNGLVSALMGAFPASLDELQHFSLIRTLEASPRLFPAYDSLRDLDPRTLQFTAQANYLNHPSPYYLLMGLVDRAAHGSVLALRLTDLGLSTLAVLIMLVAGFRALAGWKERALFALLLVLFPKLGAVAGLINNDNAALLATAIAFLGLVEWQRRPSAATGLLLAAGLALCGWTKLTVFLMAGFAVVIAEALRVARSRRAPLVAYGALAAGFGIGAAPTLLNLLSYGRVLHHSTAQAVPLALRVHLSFGRYAVIFMGNMVAKWAAVEPSTILQALGLALVLALAIAAIAVGSRRLRDARGDRTAAAWRVAIALMAATLPVLLLHLYFGWRTYVEDGFVDMAQARYYYGVWPGFALGLALLWRVVPPSGARAAVTALTVALLAVASVGLAGVGLLIHGRATIS